MIESSIQLMENETIVKEYDLSEVAKETKTKIDRSLIVTNKRIISRVDDGMLLQQEMLVSEVTAVQCAYYQPTKKGSVIPLVLILIGIMLAALGIFVEEYRIWLLAIGGVLFLVGIIITLVTGNANKKFCMGIRIMGKSAASPSISLGNPLLADNQYMALDLHVSKIVAIGLAKDLGAVVFSIQAKNA